MYWARLYTADRFAHFAQLRHAPQMFCNRLPLFLTKNLFFRHPRKKDPHSGVLAGFPGSVWAKVWGRKQLGLKAFDGH